MVFYNYASNEVKEKTGLGGISNFCIGIFFPRILILMFWHFCGSKISQATYLWF